MLPPLATVSADLSLPLAWSDIHSDSDWLQAQHEATLLLHAMAVADAGDSNSPQLQRLEAKLDLLLNYALNNRFPAPAEKTGCRIGLESIAWQASQALPVGQRGQLQLHLNSPLPVLRLPVTVSSAITVGQQIICSAQLCTWQDDIALQNWEKWVFQQHRQQIHASRQSS